MTLKIKMSNKEQVDTLRLYMREVFDYLDIDEEYIPASIESTDDSVFIYVTDEFFEYTYQYFMNILILALNTDGKKEYLEKISDEYRKGSEEFFMSNIIL